MRSFVTMALAGALVTWLGSGGVANAQKGAPTSPSVEISSPEIRTDKYSPTIDVVTKLAEKKRGPGDAEMYALVGKLDKETGEVRFYVEWAVVYTASSWRAYQGASDSNATPLVLRQVGRNVTGCRAKCVYTEAYHVDFGINQMADALEKGLDFKLYAKDGDHRIVQIPADLVQQFMKKMAEAQKMRPASQ